jgi:hypothetical protein
MRITAARVGVFIVICGLLEAAAWAAPGSKSPSRPSPTEEDPFYKVGMSLYAAGDAAKALDCFRIALRERPRDPLVRAAVRRVEAELDAARPPLIARASAQPSWLDEMSEAFDELVLVDIPQVVNFDDTLGDGESAVGTLAALNARVAQLLNEQKFALEHDRPFRKERELRSLVRRLPAVMA